MTLSMSLYWDSLLSLRWKLALFHRSGCGLIICICCYCRTRSPLSIQFAFHTETRLLAQFGSVTSSCLLRVFPVSFVICYYSLMLVTCNSHRAQRFRLRGMKIELFMGAFGSSFNFFMTVLLKQLAIALLLVYCNYPGDYFVVSHALMLTLS